MSEPNLPDDTERDKKISISQNLLQSNNFELDKVKSKIDKIAGNMTFFDAQDYNNYGGGGTSKARHTFYTNSTISEKTYFPPSRISQSSMSIREV